MERNNQIRSWLHNLIELLVERKAKMRKVNQSRRKEEQADRGKTNRKKDSDQCDQIGRFFGLWETF